MLLQQERLERKIAAGGALRRRATKTEAGTAEKAAEEDFDVADVFSILNQDDDGGEQGARVSFSLRPSPRSSLCLIRCQPTPDAIVHYALGLWQC